MKDGPTFEPTFELHRFPGPKAEEGSDHGADEQDGELHTEDRLAVGFPCTCSAVCGLGRRRQNNGNVDDYEDFFIFFRC